MPYYVGKELRYSLKDKVAYHNECANTGKAADGSKLTFAQRVNHVKAAQCSARKLNKFAKAKEMVARSKRK